jgi:hypothetical protein
MVAMKIRCRQAVRGFAGVDPKGDAAIDQALGIGRALIDLRIEAPFLLAGLGVERDDAVEGRAQIHRAESDDRRCLEFAFTPTVAAVGDVAGVILPGDLQCSDVALVDISERRIAASARVAAVVRPIRRWPARPALRE